MMVIGESVQTLSRKLTQLAADHRGKRCLELAGCVAGGFLFSAAAVEGFCLPLAMGLLCASPPGAAAVLTAMGGSLGYLVFWGWAGLQGIAWMALGLGAVVLFGNKPLERRQIFLMPAMTALGISGCGVWFLMRWNDSTPVAVYLLRVLSGAGTALVFRIRRNPGGTVAEWLAGGLGVFALAQVIPFRYLGLGYVAAGFLGATGAFPGAVLAGLALDLAQVTRVKMAGVLCLAFCLRLIPRQPKWMAMLAPALAFVPVALLGGVWDVLPLPGLLAGGLCTAFLPDDRGRNRSIPRRGETAVVQVRLEQTAVTLRQMERMIELTAEPGVDRPAILLRAVQNACDGCPERKQCKGRQKAEGMDDRILEQPGLTGEDVPEGCRKNGRMLGELRRGQEQLRRMKGQRNHLSECRGAVAEQYGFLAEYLEKLADDLSRREEYQYPRFRPEIGVSSRSSHEVNGDLCSWFPGTGNRYYVLLCDGMGVGVDAARESREVSQLLRQMLGVGIPAEHALRSLNSMCLLRDLPGCSTVDLVQIHLDTGWVRIYKWGAAPSWLLEAGQIKKIGTACPPPGLSQRAREKVDRLSLGGGEVLILLSDGAGEEMLLQKNWASSAAPGEIAAAILEGGGSGEDDATAVVVRLVPEDLSKQ